MEVRQLNNVLYEPNASNTHNAQISARVSNLSDPEQLSLVEQLLENLESEEPAGQLAFISNGNKGFKPTGGAHVPRPPAACFAMAIEGKCSREKCTYSHDHSILQAYLEELKVKIVKSPYHAPTRSTFTPTGSSSKGYQKQNSIAVNDTESPHEFHCRQ